MPQLITNGDFETGTFAGWTVSSSETTPFTAALQSTASAQIVDSVGGNPAWFLKNVASSYFGTPASPINDYTAFNAFDGSGGNFVLSQTLTINHVVSGTLSFDFATQATYSGTARTFDVVLTNSQGATVANFFHYDLPFSNTAWSPTHVSVDVGSALAALAPGSYTLSFIETVPAYFTGPADFGIDNISLQAVTNHAPVILTDTTGLQGMIMQPGTYTDGSTITGHNYFANGGAPAATFTATTLNYNLIPGDGDSSNHITTLQQFLNNGGTDGNTLSADGNLFPASTYFEMKGFFYQAAGQTYSFTLQADDGAVLYINGQQVLNDDGIHGNGAVTGGAYTATTTGYVPIEFDYFENAFGGASFHATVNGHDFSPADLVRPSSLGGAFTEAANATGSNVSQTNTGSFAFTDQDLTDTHTVSAGSPAIAWSNGTVPASVATALAGAFSVTLAQNSGASTAGLVNYSFSTPDKTFDFLAAGETLTVTYTVTVADNNGGTATQPITFTVTGTNDAPVMGAPALAQIIETAGTTGSAAPDQSVTLLPFSDVDLTDRHTVTVGAPTVQVDGGSAPAGLAAQLASALTTGLADSTGAGHGTVTATFTAPDSAFDFLAAGQTMRVTYNVTVDDGHGGSVTQPVAILITGTNDAPVLAADGGLHSITEQAGQTGSGANDTADFTLSYTDADLIDVHSPTASLSSVAWSGGVNLPASLQSALANALAVQAIDNGAGQGTVNAHFQAADSTFDFLAAGETLTITYLVTVDDHNGGTSSQPVTITVTGTNDAPILTGPAGPMGLAEMADATGSSAVDAATVMLPFTDVDLNDTHTASYSLAGINWSNGAVPSAVSSALTSALSLTETDTAHTGAGSINATFAAADQTFDFLGQGETLTVSYNVTVTDNNGATSTQTVQFTVTGANDAPVVNADTVASHNITEIAGATGSTANDAASGNLSFSDADLNDTHTVAKSLVSAVWSGGASIPAASLATLQNALSTTLTDSRNTGTGSVGFTLNAQDKTFDFLAAGETLSLTYNVTVTDSHGVSSTQPVNFKVTGTNDVPVLAADPAGNAMNVSAGYDGGRDTSFVTVTNTSGATINNVVLSGVGGLINPTAGHLASTAGAASVNLGSLAAGASITYFFAGSGALIFDFDDPFTGAAKYTVTGSLGGTTVSGSFDPFTNASGGFVGFLGNNSSGFESDTPVASTLVVKIGGGGHQISELTGQTGASAPHTTSASLNFTDADLNDHHTASATVGSISWSGGATLPSGLATALAGAVSTSVTDSTGTGAGSVALNFSAPDATFDFLAAGETLTVTYNIAINDGQGGTSTQPVTIRITGTNDTPVMSADTGPHAITEIAGATAASTADSVSGSLAFTDVDLNDTHSVSKAFQGGTWSGGTVSNATLQALGNALSLSLTDSHGSGSGSVGYAFSAPDKVFDFLAAGETLTFSWNVTVTDNHGATSTQPVTFVVTGTNDRPVLAADAGPHAITELAGTNNATADTASTTLAFTDVDLNDHHTASVGAPSISWSGGATLPSGLAAALTGALTTSVADSTGTGAGSVTASFSAADSTFDFLAAGETLTVTYAVTVTDNNGATSTQNVTVVVTGTNDTPVLSADSGPHAITELSGTGNATADTATTTLAFADVDLNDHHTASVGAPSISWSGGATLPSGLAAALAGALSTSVTDSTGTGAGSVTASFSAADSNFDFLAAGETLTVTYAVTVTDNNGATSNQNVTVVVTGTNDTPVLSADSGPHGITELAGTANGGADTATTTLAFTDVDLNDHHTASVGTPSIAWSGGASLPSGLAALLGGALTTSVADSTGTGTGSVTASFSAPDKAFDFLAAGETLTVTYNVTVTDNNGALSTQPVTIVVTGTNDTPVLTADTGPHAITELAGTGNATADTATTTLAFADVDLNDHHTASVGAPAIVWSGGATLPSGLAATLTGALSTSVADSTGTGAGSVTASFSAADSTFDFLAVGETLTVTYNVTVTDNNGATSTQPVTVVVTGTNDVPVIAAGTVSTGTVNELALTTGSSAIDSASGVVNFSDPDLNDRPTATISAQSITAHLASGGTFALTAAQAAAFEADFQIAAAAANANTGAINWSFNAQDKTLDFLGVGETVTLVSTVKIDDHHGGVVSQDVTVTLVGADDAPTTAPDIAGVQKNSSITVDKAHGVLANDTDVDIHDRGMVVSAVNGQAANVGHALQGTYGALTLNADGSYSYVANTKPGALPAGLVAQDVFTYTANDGHGGTTVETLTVSVYNNGQSYTQGTPGVVALSPVGANGSQMLDAGIGTHTIVGGNGPDDLIVGWGAATMTGGSGPDTFVFSHNAFGTATITDFVAGTDKLQFDHHVLASFTDVVGHAAQVGANVVITVDANDTITLQNVSLGALHSTDMLFI